MAHGYTYQTTLTTSERIRWRVEDLIGGPHRLDFGRSFLPESLARVEPLRFLSDDEKRLLNQIRGHGYLYMFGLVEEFILPFVMDHTREIIHGESARARAMLQFAAEEAKHIDLFRRFREEFLKGFGHPCPVIGPPQEIAKAVLSHDRLGVALAILHIEWMTQKHYLESAHGDASLDPQFKSLLRHHWMEEAQHAKLDTLMVEAIAEERDEAGKLHGAEQYLEIGCLLDRGLCQQVAFDVECFENVSGRRLRPAEREAMERVQIQANRWTYLGSGMTHPNFVASLQALSPAAHVLVAKVAPAFC